MSKRPLTLAQERAIVEEARQERRAEETPGVPCRICGKPTGVSLAVLRANHAMSAQHPQCCCPIDDP